MWIRAEAYAELKIKADRADRAEARLVEIEQSRDEERARHYSHTLQLTNQLMLACGRWPVKDTLPEPAETQTPKPTLPASVLEDAEEMFVEDYTEAGKSRDEAIEAYKVFRETGVMPFEQEIV